MKLDIFKNYSRKGNVIYENGIPVVKLKQSNIHLNIEKLSDDGINYMNRYIEMFPDLVEIIVEKSEKKNEQISLF